MSEEPDPQSEPTDASPSVTVSWAESGDGVAIAMHKMSGPVLHAIAAILHHEAEKMLFHADMAAAEQARKNGISKLALPRRQ